MTVSISIEFLTNRYHATSWSHQVNEGIVEFPPSPWRILRALVSAYYRLPETPTREKMCELVTILASKYPCYYLPEFTEAHTRHFMPIRKEGKNKTTKVIDTFYLMQDKLKVFWDVNLDDEQIQLLKTLCGQISYIGRAESWSELSVTVDLVDLHNNQELHHPENSDRQVETNDNQPIYNYYLTKDNDSYVDDFLANNYGYQQKLLVPLSSEALAGFKLGVESAFKAMPLPKKAKAKLCLPNDVLELLSLDIGDLHAHKWNGIPGTEWVRGVKLEQKQASAKNQPKTSTRQKTINLARYQIVSNVLPQLTGIISISDKLHQAAISKADKLLKHSPKSSYDPHKISIFSGKDINDNPLKYHQHAYYLPEVNQDNKITHLLVYARQEFSQLAIDSLQKITFLWGHKSERLELQLVWIGDADDYIQYNQREKINSIFSKSQKWLSFTPLVLPRHPKCYNNGTPKINPETGLQIDGWEDQTRKLLGYLGYPSDRDSLQVNLIAQRNQGFTVQRYNGGGSLGPKTGYWLELDFSEPQTGAIALGYASHFGLGTFVPFS